MTADLRNLSSGEPPDSLGRNGVAGLLYLLAAIISMALSRQPGSVASLWFANAIAVAALLNLPLPRWLPMLAIIALANVAANLLFGSQGLQALAFLPANLCEILFSTLLLRQRGLLRRFDQGPLEMLQFLLLGAVVPPVLGAVLGSATLYWAGMSSFAKAWPAWYSGSVIGTTAMLPLACWWSREGLAAGKRLTQWPQLLPFVAVASAVALIAIVYLPFPFVYVGIPLIVGATYLGTAEVAFGALAAALAVGAMLGLGYFVPPPMITNWQVLLLYLPLMMALVPALILVAGMNQSRQRESARVLSDSRLKGALQFAATGFAIANAEGRLIDANQWFCRMLGYSLEEVLGKSQSDFTHPEDLERSSALLDGLLRGDFQHYENRKRYLHKSGRVIWGQVRVSRFPSAVGAETLIVQVDDITEQVMAAEALAKARDELQTIIDHMPALVGYWDANQINRFANKLYNDWYGVSPQHMRGQHIRDTFGDDKYTFNKPFIDKALAGESSMFERAIVDQKQQLHLGLASYVPDLKDGVVQGFYIFVTDITPIKEAQSARARAEARLQNIIDAASEFSIIATDLNGVITLFSPGAERMLGYRADELVGKQTPALIHVPSEVAARAELLSQELGRPIAGFETFVAKAREGVAEAHEWHYVRKDGTRIPVNLTVNAVHNAAGELSGFLGIAKDVTAQRQLNQAMLQAKQNAEAASKAKSDFLANMSHEIRTPMNAVLGVAQLLENTPLSGEQRKFLTMIRSAGQNLMGILNDILDFSKIEAGHLQLLPAPFDLAKVLDGIAAIMAANSGRKALELGIGLEPEVPLRVVGDQLRLQQVLVNLVGNAIKFTESGEVVLFVRLESRQDNLVWLLFEVRDTGIGMSSAQVERLFQPFQQADSSMTRRFGGTGLGLSISRRLVEMMGGSIDVNSELGAGSRFAVRLPLQVIADTATPDASAQVASLRLLIADDNDSSRDCLQSIIRRWHWQADSVASLAQALDTLGTARQQGMVPDVLLIDRSMEGMADAQVLLKLRAAVAPQALGIMVLASPREYDEVRQWDLSLADRVLTKPVTSSSLFDGLQELFAPKLVASQQDAVQRERKLRGEVFKGYRLLLVEDNALNQVVARGFLEPLGLQLDVADNGKIAVAKLRANPQGYDLVLMDVQMPVMDGYTATRAIRDDLHLSLPVIAMSAGVTEEERGRCSDSGMDGFIHKPIDLTQMVAELQRFLRPAPGAPADPAALAQLAAGAAGMAAPGGLPEAVAGALDTAAAPVSFASLLQMAAKNQRLRRTIQDSLKRMTEQGMGLIDSAESAFQAGDKTTAARVFHTLRGAIWAAGLSDWISLCRSAEESVAAGDWSALQRLLVKLRGRYAEILQEAAHCNARLADLPTAEAPKREADAQSLAVDQAQLQRLIAQVQEQNFAALRLFDQLRGGLQQLLKPHELKLLETELDALDFPAAALRLQALQDRLSSLHQQ